MERLAAAVGIGVVAGLAGGVYFAGFVRALLYETEAINVWGFGLRVMYLVVVALAAGWMPARRATRVDPAEALRSE